MHSKTINAVLDTGDVNFVIFQIVEQFKWLFMDPQSPGKGETFLLSGKSVINKMTVGLIISLKQKNGKVLVSFRGYSENKEELERTLPRLVGMFTDSVNALSGISVS